MSKVKHFFVNFDSVLLEKAVEFFKAKLDILHSDIPVNIELVDNIGRGNVGGICVADYDLKLNKLNKVDIEIKRCASVIGLIEVLAHELVHAKQFIKGDTTHGIEYRKFLFFRIPRAKKYWKGEDVTDLEYMHQPAELEAHMLQKHLTLEFLKLYESQIEPTNISNLLLNTLV